MEGYFSFRVQQVGGLGLTASGFGFWQIMAAFRFAAGQVQPTDRYWSYLYFISL